ncbi:MAG: hypothetical protein LPK45_07260 [Bacteroidota bacterium]|nr:hypothetical protein [Bacteroidota bacterium]MDX5430874.1 hypothetical protein [Bacteroidota bacterium]MDX5469619.1 hypothetical protein [Bacteroidota bacterium]
MKTRNLWMTVMVIAVSILLMSCEKLTNPVEDAEQTAESAEDFGSDMIVMNEMIQLVQDVVTNDPNASGKKGSSLLPDGVTVTYEDDDTDPSGGMTIILNMDAVTEIEDISQISGGYTNVVGKVYKGTTYITISGPYDSIGCEIQVSHNPEDRRRIPRTTEKAGYFSIDGSKYLIYTSERKPLITMERLSNESWDVKGYFIIRTRTAGYSRRTSITPALTLNQVAGILTKEDVNDDAFEISGSLKSRNRSDIPYEVLINKTLYVVGDKSCSKIFTEGEIQLKNEGSSIDVKVDFGDRNDCDNKFTILLPGNQKKVITL